MQKSISVYLRRTRLGYFFQIQCHTQGQSCQYLRTPIREKRSRTLRNINEFIQPRVRSVSNGTESVRFKGPRLWQTLPPTIRNSESLCHFKTKITNWYGEIVHANYAAFLFQTWAIYEKQNYISILYRSYTLINCKYFIHYYLG